MSDAVALYKDNRCPELARGENIKSQLAALDPYMKNKYLDEADAVARDYQRAFKTVLAPGTIRIRLAYLRAAVRYARREHQFGRGLPDPTLDMSMPKVSDARQVYATLPQLDALWAAFTNAESRAVFRLAFYLGLRWRTELLDRARKEHIKVEGDDVWLDIGKTKNGALAMKWVHPAAREDLKFIPFELKSGSHYAQWHKAVEKIGRPEMRPHDLRHSLASEILSRSGGNLDHVRAALHHKALSSAQRYAHLYPSAQKAILSAIGENQQSTQRLSRKPGRPRRKAA